jgi:hypothetical protein
LLNALFVPLDALVMSFVRCDCAYAKRAGATPKNRVASGRLVVEQILCEIEGHYLGKSCWKIPRHSSIRDQKTRRIPKMKKPLPVMMVTSARHGGRYAVGGLVGGMGHIQSRLHSRQ